MSWKTGQFIPEEAIVSAVILEAICPVLKAILQDTGTSACLSVRVVAYNELAPARTIGPDGILATVSSKTDGEARLWFRQTFSPERALYHIEAIIHGVRPETGYSGFTLRGSVKKSDQSVVVELPATVVSRYNERNWRGPR